MRALFTALAIAALPTAVMAQTPPPAEIPALYEIAVAPSPERIETDIATLVGFGTRHTLSETESETRGIGAARRWIHAEFERISAACGGCLEVMYVSDTVTGARIPEPAEVVSVIAIQRGTADPDRYVLMSGDIDSRVTDVLNAVDDSPGANDNASGVAGTARATKWLASASPSLPRACRSPSGYSSASGLSGPKRGCW